VQGSGALAVFVIGTRAQLIKVAPVVVACERNAQPVLLLMTGQHKETMQDLVEEFGIGSPQQSVVDVSERSTVLSLLRWVPRAYLGLAASLRRIKAEHGAVNVVVHGDTMSTVLGALAARRCGLRVFHLESGLTSGKLLDPFPEELSRRIVFRLTDVAICPGAGPTALMAGKYRCLAVDSVENTIVDAVMMATAGATAPAGAASPYFVASLHRFQNIFDARRLRYLLGFITEVAARYPVYFVLHPSTRKRLEAEGLLDQLSSIAGLKLSPRLGYRQFLALAAGAACVLTDGGSNQEELAVLGVPTIVMRQHTERLDGLGENAVMEGDLASGLSDYCLSGGFQSLRRPSRVKAEMGPSALVARLLDRAEV
jgi:UDP-N-acetylglucosamine 2-epimerase (non-hydrolysing)